MHKNQNEKNLINHFSWIATFQSYQKNYRKFNLILMYVLVEEPHLPSTNFINFFEWKKGVTIQKNDEDNGGLLGAIHSKECPFRRSSTASSMLSVYGQCDPPVLTSPSFFTDSSAACIRLSNTLCWCFTGTMPSIRTNSLWNYKFICKQCESIPNHTETKRSLYKSYP